MSASERMREMGGRFEGPRISDIPPPVIELRFWGRLIAVVEAAERVAAIPDGGLEALDRLGAPEMLDAALAELDKALS